MMKDPSLARTLSENITVFDWRLLCCAFAVLFKIVWRVNYCFQYIIYNRYYRVRYIYYRVRYIYYRVRYIYYLTHSCPYESSRSVTLFESHSLRIPNKRDGQNPFSAMMTKYVKNPADAWIIPIWPYAIPISLQCKSIISQPCRVLKWMRKKFGAWNINESEKNYSANPAVCLK